MSLNVSKEIDLNTLNYTRRLVNKGAESILGEVQPVLDKGYVKLVDYMGVDETVVAAARHSYDKGVKLDDAEGNTKLINFLMNHAHTSPFEQPALVFEVKAPIFVFREWHRHRTAKLNEMSSRYTQLPSEFYIPERDRIQTQSKTNKQGSGEKLSDQIADTWMDEYLFDAVEDFKTYEWAVEQGMARELARISLPVSTYSKMVWQMDLHNLLHFLRLRMAPGAQYEIREYANVIGEIVKLTFPKVWAAFEEYVLYSVKLSRSEVETMKKFIESYQGSYQYYDRPAEMSAVLSRLTA
jgi:thymidylate synthase (FAD)